MTKANEEKSPYKQVVIMGPDWNDSFIGERSLKWGDNVLVLGDGKKDITFDEIRKELTGKINEFTRIDIMAHGGIGDNDPIGTHSITLSDTLVSSASVFKLLSEVNSHKSIYIHLWACYSDNADKEFQYLPEGSVAIFHSNKNSVSYSIKDYDGRLLSFSELQYAEYDNTLAGVKQNLDISLHNTILSGGGGLKFHQSGKTYTVKYVIPEIVNANRGYFDFIYEYWRGDGEQSFVLASDDIEKDISDFCDSVSHFMKCDEMQGLTKQEFMKKIRDIRNNYMMLHFLDNEDLITARGILESRKKENVVNAKGTRGVTPIFHARSVSAIKLLAEYGADLNYKDRNGYTFLSIKVYQNNIGLVKTLLDTGADPNILVGNKGITAIYYAKSPEVIKLLVEHGADINHKDKDGNTALSRAVKYNEIKIVKALLDAGADPNVIDGLDKIPNPEIVKLLIGHRVGINYAAKSNNLEVERTFVGNQRQTETVANFPHDLTIDAFQPGQLPDNSSSTDDSNTQDHAKSNKEPHVRPVEVQFDFGGAILIGIAAIKAASSAYSSLSQYLDRRFGTLAEPEVQAKIIANIKKLPRVAVDGIQEQILRDRGEVRELIKDLEKEMHNNRRSLSQQSNPKIQKALEKQYKSFLSQRATKRELYETLTNLRDKCDFIEAFQKECDEIKKLDNITAKQASVLVKKLDSAQAALDAILQYEHKHIMVLKDEVNKEIKKLKPGMLKKVKVDKPQNINEEIRSFDKSRLKSTKIDSTNSLNWQFGDHDIKI